MGNQFRHRYQLDNQDFKTPEQVAATDNQTSGSPLISHNPINNIAESKDRQKNNRFKFWPPTKKTWIVVIVVLIIVVGGLILIFKGHKSIPPKVSQKPNIASKASSTVASTLTGLQVSPATNQLPITAVMVENSLAARPQSGLSQAGVVFEALAEGGITRFVALYQSNSSSVYIGPIRSARPYFISWLLGFDAVYAHVGGSPLAETDIAQWGVRDIDQYYNASYYQRITSRVAPHNVYSTMASLYKLEQAKGFTSSQFTSWQRKPAQPLKTPTATSINLYLSNAYYNASYTYDQATNSYNRDVGGSPQIDADTNKQISPSVVIAIVVPESNGPLDSSGAYYSVYQTIGSGQAYVFQDGGVTIGNWSKSSNNSQILFTTSNGQPLALDPGQVWVTAISSSSNISYN